MLDARRTFGLLKNKNVIIFNLNVVLVYKQIIRPATTYGVQPLVTTTKIEPK